MNWSRIGLGTSTLASLGQALPAEKQAALFRTAIDCGVNVIDTADTYASGEAERVVANQTETERGRIFIVTKGGMRFVDLSGIPNPLNQVAKKILSRIAGNTCFTHRYLMDCIQQSRGRLRRTTIDGYLLHNPTLEDLRREHALDSLQEIQRLGYAHRVGVSSNAPAVLAEAAECPWVNLIQTPVDKDASNNLRSVWKVATARGLHILGNSVFRGMQSDQHRDAFRDRLREAAEWLGPASTILIRTNNPANLARCCEWLA